MNKKEKKLINTQVGDTSSANTPHPSPTATPSPQGEGFGGTQVQTSVKTPTQVSAPAAQTGVKASGSTYVPSDRVKAAEAAIAAQQKPVAYTSKWGAQIDDTLNKILNREEFSYDVNADKLYDQYKNQAARNGKLAMEDTVAKMSSMTGGYGNSFAQTAGQAAFAGEMQKVNDIIPELYQLALQRYTAEGDAMRQNYGLLLDAEATDYGRHRDEMSDYLTERDYLRGIYDDERAFDYGAWSDQQDRDYREKTDAMENMWRSLEWNRKVSDSDWEKNFAEEDRNYDHMVEAALAKAEYGDFSGLADVYGVDEKTAKALWTESRYAGMYSGGGSKGTGGEDVITAVEPEYLPFGSMGENDFYKSMEDIYYSYNDPENEGRGIEAAVALVKRVGATEEAKAAFGDYFGEALMNKYFPKPVAEENQGYDVDYSSWSAGEWEEYFAYIRQNESPENAEKELNDLVKQGVIPQNMISYARKGASGTLGH